MWISSPSIRALTPRPVMLRWNRSVNCWVGEVWAWASLTIRTTRASVESLDSFVTSISSAPSPFTDILGQGDQHVDGE